MSAVTSSFRSVVGLVRHQETWPMESRAEGYECRINPGRETYASQTYRILPIRGSERLIF